MSVLPLSCTWGGKNYDIGDEWKPDPLTTCKCVGPSSVACSRVMPCFDRQKNQRQPGDRWLEDPTTNCTCTDTHFVMCQKLDEPVCMDASGNLRKNRETWISSSCVDCSCINGSINCTGYGVNVTYGLFSVTLVPTCETCGISSGALEKFSTCKGKQTSSKLRFLSRRIRSRFTRCILQLGYFAVCPDTDILFGPKRGQYM